jgi:RNA polymerase sigma-70 factor (ECF subfamily)
MKHVIAVFIFFAFSFCAFGLQETYRLDNALVRYEGVSEEYARALGETAQTARAVALKEFAFDMPETFVIQVDRRPGERARLFCDGRNYLSLTIRSEKDLHKPSESGVFTLYGICHEIGHIAMYRLIPEHGWLTTEAREGWAHYLGSRIVDEVYAEKGAAFWPDAYDYLADGTMRLKKQLESTRPTPVAKGAGLWMDLVKIVGDKEVAPIFSAWGKADVDFSDPGAAVRKALLAANSDERLPDWWNRAEASLVFRRPKSQFAARTASVRDLANSPIELSHDDGKMAGKRSLAGEGHGVRFEVTGEDWYLTAVQIHGSRYGYPRLPREDFHLWLCDDECKVVADFPFPYAKFSRGAPEWVNLKMKRPTNVPAKFALFAGFIPTRTKGVFVSHDKEASGTSLVGLPGKEPRLFDGGDWLIRAELAQPKGADPLHGGP